MCFDNISQDDHNTFMTKEYICVGLMSGTSLDGVDTGIFRISFSDQDSCDIKLIQAETFPIDRNLRNEILQQISGSENALHRLTLLNMLLGELYGECVNKLLQKSNIDAGDVTVIGSHGQTMYHIGRKELFCSRDVSGTLQIGDGAVIAQRTGIPTVSDFRTADMAAGGEGAPFVPLLDRILSRKYTGSTAWQNIGGIGNVSYIENDTILAFDTGPGNMILDQLVEHFSNGEKHYDKDGEIALSGRLIPSLLDKWMSHPYLKALPPKTTGRELFGRQFFDDYPFNKDFEFKDILHTAAVYTAMTIAESYKTFLPGLPATVIVSGGGVHNPVIMNTLRKELPDSKIISADEDGISSDFKETAAFALMGLYFMLDIPGNEPQATGADYPVITGKLSKPVPRGPLHV